MLRASALTGVSSQERGSMIRHRIVGRNRRADDTRLRRVVARASVA
jgi:hypothetical protein